MTLFEVSTQPGNVPEERFSNAELVTGIFNCLHFTLIYDNIC